MQQQASGHQRRMRNGRATFCAHIDFTARVLAVWRRRMCCIGSPFQISSSDCVPTLPTGAPSSM